MNTWIKTALRCGCVLCLVAPVVVVVIVNWPGHRHYNGPNQNLLFAIERNDATGVSEALRQGADPNARFPLYDFFTIDPITGDSKHRGDKSLPPPIMVAAHVDQVNPSIIASLLAHGARVDEPDERGDRLLNRAASLQDLVLVRLALSYKANPDYSDSDGSDPLITAAFTGNQQIVNELVGRTKNIDATDSNGWSALIYASQQGWVGVVKILLDHGADVNVRDKNGKTALAIIADDVNSNKESKDISKMLQVAATRRQLTNRKRK